MSLGCWWMLWGWMHHFYFLICVSFGSRRLSVAVFTLSRWYVIIPRWISSLSQLRSWRNETLVWLLRHYGSTVLLIAQIQLPLLPLDIYVILSTHIRTVKCTDLLQRIHILLVIDLIEFWSRSLILMLLLLQYLLKQSLIVVTLNKCWLLFLKIVLWMGRRKTVRLGLIIQVVDLIWGWFERWAWFLGVASTWSTRIALMRRVIWNWGKVF